MPRPYKTRKPYSTYHAGGYDDRTIAAAAGRKRMRSQSAAEHQQKAGTALLRQHGVGYFSAMGKASAAARAKARMK
jgi:hypothetical protein